MAGNSPEDEKRLPVTVDRIVQTKKSDEQGEYVVFKFGLFGDKEEAVRQAYATYIAGIQISEALAEQGESKFFRLTGCLASDVYNKAQERWHELRQRIYMERVSAARLPPAQ
ncbi:MAG: hypothetical protein NT149_01920 [Candidatus Gottesmanbacteria bacterium]|nr:hypothetical protein [Candidatus Gottesmanbacteria bacterium]